jgi:tetratricopeptide (TPR) repeat protein
MTTTPNRVAGVCFALVLVASLAAAARPKPDARPHVERAMKAHRAGKFDEALTELQAAYAIEPKPELLFAIGQVYTKLGRCSEAGDAYKRFLATGSDPKAAQVVQQAMDACKPRAAASPPPAKPPEPPPAAQPPPTTQPPPATATTAQPPPAEPPQLAQQPPRPEPVRRQPPAAAPRPLPPPSPSTPHRSPWYRDVLGDALVVTGAVSLVLGGVMYRSAVSDLDAAEGAPTHDRYVDLVDDARTKRLYSVVLVGGGVALVGAGVLRFVMRGPRTETRRVAIMPARGGGLVTWSRSF